MPKTILVADDSKTIRHVVHLAFQATEYQVVGVESGRDAVERARTVRPDLVLVDVGMPGLDGYQLCQALKDEGATAHIPVVLMAGAFEAFDERRAQAARADGHIKKPFETQKLLDQVGALTARRPAPAPAVVAAAPAFGVPIAEAPTFAAAPPPSSSWEDQPIEEVEPLDDAEPLDEAELGVSSPDYGPSLEPPPAPDPEEEAHRRSVDVWALSDESLPAPPAAPRARLPSIDEDLEPPPVRTPSAPEHVAEVAAPAIAAAAAPAVAAAAASVVPPGLPREELVAIAREVIEQIAWEVVPELAETIIREELRRLLAERGA